LWRSPKVPLRRDSDPTSKIDRKRQIFDLTDH
jgi:hypothetical protein